MTHPEKFLDKELFALDFNPDQDNLLYDSLYKKDVPFYHKTRCFLTSSYKTKSAPGWYSDSDQRRNNLEEPCSYHSGAPPNDGDSNAVFSEQRYFGKRNQMRLLRPAKRIKHNTSISTGIGIFTKPADQSHHQAPSQVQKVHESIINISECDHDHIILMDTNHEALQAETKRLNERLRQDPSQFSLWLQLIYLQDAYYQRALCSYQTMTQKKLAIIQRAALCFEPSSSEFVKLIKLKLNISLQAHSQNDVLQTFQQAVHLVPSDVDIWMRYISLCLGNSTSSDIFLLRNLFKKALTQVVDELHQGRLFFSLVFLESAAGHDERWAHLIQLFLEKAIDISMVLSTTRPNSIETEALQHQQIKTMHETLFLAFIRSKQPRIGEIEAPTFVHWIARAMQKLSEPQIVIQVIPPPGMDIEMDMEMEVSSHPLGESAAIGVAKQQSLMKGLASNPDSTAAANHQIAENLEEPLASNPISQLEMFLRREKDASLMWVLGSDQTSGSNAQDTIFEGGKEKLNFRKAMCIVGMEPLPEELYSYVESISPLAFSDSQQLYLTCFLDYVEAIIPKYQCPAFGMSEFTLDCELFKLASLAESLVQTLPIGDHECFKRLLYYVIGGLDDKDCYYKDKRKEKFLLKCLHGLTKQLSLEKKKASMAGYSVNRSDIDKLVHPMLEKKKAKRSYTHTTPNKDHFTLRLCKLLLCYEKRVHGVEGVKKATKRLLQAEIVECSESQIEMYLVLAEALITAGNVDEGYRILITTLDSAKTMPWRVQLSIGALLIQCEMFSRSTGMKCNIIRHAYQCAHATDMTFAESDMTVNIDYLWKNTNDKEWMARIEESIRGKRLNDFWNILLVYFSAIIMSDERKYCLQDPVKKIHRILSLMEQREDQLRSLYEVCALMYHFRWCCEVDGIIVGEGVRPKIGDKAHREIIQECLKKSDYNSHVIYGILCHLILKKTLMKTDQDLSSVNSSVMLLARPLVNSSLDLRSRKHSVILSSFIKAWLYNELGQDRMSMIILEQMNHEGEWDTTTFTPTTTGADVGDDCDSWTVNNKMKECGMLWKLGFECLRKQISSGNFIGEERDKDRGHYMLLKSICRWLMLAMRSAGWTKDVFMNGLELCVKAGIEKEQVDELLQIMECYGILFRQSMMIT